MKPQFLAPKGALDKKPPHGAPCTRCGLCCMATICPMGSRVLRLPEIAGLPCPALQKTADGLYACGLVVDPARYVPAQVMQHGHAALSDAAALLIDAGGGCDARFNGEPINTAFYQKLQRLDEARAPEIAAAKAKWGVAS